MGTRADFYVGRGEDAEWLGSIAYDGYPEGHPSQLDGNASEEAHYREDVVELLGSVDHASLPDRGWPWPWEDSATTDYAYAWEDGRVWISNFGQSWISWDDYHALPAEDEGGAYEEYCKGKPRAVFPNMEDRQNVRFDKGSGILIIGG